MRFFPAPGTRTSVGRIDDLPDAPGRQAVALGEERVAGAVAVGAPDLLVSHLVGQIH